MMGTKSFGCVIWMKPKSSTVEKKKGAPKDGRAEKGLIRLDQDLPRS